MKKIKIYNYLKTSKYDNINMLTNKIIDLIISNNKFNKNIIYNNCNIIDIIDINKYL